MFSIYFKKFCNRNLYFIAVFVILVNLSGCDSGSSRKPVAAEPEPTPVSPATAVWSSPAYGLVADISETTVSFYQVTSQHCQVYPLGELLGIDFDSLIASSQVSADRTELNTTLAGAKRPGIVLEKMDTVPQLCIDNLVVSIEDANYEFSARTDFEIFWLTFSELYAFFDIEGVNWAQVYEEATLAVTTTTTKEELFGVFAEMIRPLRDFHVEIVSQELEFEYTSPARKVTVDNIALIDFLAINDIDRLASEEQYFQYLEYLELQKSSAYNVIFGAVVEGEDIHFNDSQTIFWGRLEGNVGYLLVNSMDNANISDSEEIGSNLASLTGTIDQVLSDIAGTEGLIVDVRYNEGGNDFVSQYIAGRLTNQSYDAYSKQSRSGDIRTPLQHVEIEPRGATQYSGPIAVLTSMTTASAAETFTLSMRERMNTVIVGEATAGGFSDQLIKVLPSGTVFTLSNEIYVSVTGQEFEGVGVPVDIEHPFFNREQRESGRDLGFEAAFDWLINF